MQERDDALRKSILTILKEEEGNTVDLVALQVTLEVRGRVLALSTLRSDCEQLQTEGLVEFMEERSETEDGELEYDIAWASITPVGVKELSRLNA
ncbi:MAG: hypothetical protein KAJ19_24095 [Gammaproteobacteria bacterium]|nr:hypothetical protein [Gammaproteobacteria bacterium]